MVSFKMLAVAGAVAGLTVAGGAWRRSPAGDDHAAGMQEFSGWYLRGNIA